LGAGRLPEGPEAVTELVLNVEGGQLVATVLRFRDGSVRARFGQGNGVGFVLTAQHVAALRVMLANTLSAMYEADRRAA
jgi:hypothetical protein